ncbi:hypothetical protein B7494_g4358 [Chlorociboria aeruginascens]|nr:hypothetical protein B7494_g4358 [Chlorociboria aeruginascens]
MEEAILDREKPQEFTVDAIPLPNLESGATSPGSKERVQPTPEELLECRHVKNSLSTGVWLVAFLGLAERFCYYGIIVMFQNYIQNSRTDPLRPGALGLGQSLAGVIQNCFTLFSLMTPICAAIIADSWLGRYRTLCIALCIYIVGTVILITTSLPTALAHGSGLPGFIVALFVLGFAVGGVKATIGPFIADQCTDEAHFISYTKSGEKVIVSREATVEYIFNIYYWCVNAGALAGIATTFMEKDIGFWAAFLMPSCFLAAAVVLFFATKPLYVDHRPDKNILPDAFRACLYGIKGGRRMDAAKPENVLEKYGKTVPWTASFVEELKNGLTAFRAFIAFVIYWLCQTQMSTNLISQSANMNSHGVPNDLLPTINSVTVVILLPIVQHLVNPTLRRMKIAFPPINRMTVGFIIEAMAMAYVAGIQKLVYNTGPCFDHPRKCAASNNGDLPNNVNMLIQIPVYVLEGAGEVFSNPAGYEYAYTKASMSIKAVVQAAFQFSSAAGSALALALSPTYKDPQILTMFSCLAGFMFLDACIFYACFRKENKKSN